MPLTRSRTIGEFVWDATADQWRWDAGMFDLHGYPPGAVAPSTDLVLAHKQDEHRCHAESLLQLAATTDKRFSNYHGIVDAAGRRRTVLVVGQSRLGDPASPHAHRFSRGFMVDVTGDESERTHRAVSRARATTASIQQALGLLMGSLGLDEGQAFSVLSRVASHHNVKVRDLARRFMGAAVAGAADTPRDLSQVLVAEAAALALERTVGAPGAPVRDRSG